MKTNKLKHVFLTLSWILAATVICSAQTTLYFPQIADGTQPGGIIWSSAIAITNPAAPGTPAATGMITLTQDNGTAFNVAFTDERDQPVGSGNTIPFQVAGGQTKFFQSTGKAALNQGFATVTSTLPIAGAAVFFEFNGNNRIAEAGLPAATPLMQQGIFGIRDGRVDTGIAVANPGTGTVTITFQLLDPEGNAIPVVTRTLAAKNHTAFFLSQLFPSITQLIGTLRIVSDTPIVTIALLFESTGQFATFPVFPMQ